MNIVQMDGAHSTDNESGQNNVKKPDKPLRFVTNYGAPHPKRRRIGAACLTCRKRKTACSGKTGSRYTDPEKIADVSVTRRATILRYLQAEQA
jgi:hypothetical protein